MRGIFNRGSGSGGGRGSRSPRGAFGKAAARETSLSGKAKVMRAAAQVSAKVEKHHARHQEKWIAKRYGELLKKSGSPFRLAPRGHSSDLKAQMMWKARFEVNARLTKRLARVEAARSNMLQTGKIRASRKMDWGRGLGE